MDFLPWLWFEEAKNEMWAIMTTPDEIDLEDGYAPWMRGLGLVDRTYYSVSICPNLHWVCHIVGSLAPMKRSFNAKAVEPMNMSCCQNAALIHFVFRKKLILAFKFQFLKEIR